MVSRISGAGPGTLPTIGDATSLSGGLPGGLPGAGEGGGFAEALQKAVDGVNTQQVHADQAIYGLATGQNADLHSTMIALEEANISIRTMASTRDKIVEAYQQIWNMPI